MRGQRAGQGRPRRWGLGADPEARRGAGGAGVGGAKENAHPKGEMGGKIWAPPRWPNGMAQP